jgi:hypothetical protein
MSKKREKGLDNADKSEYRNSKFETNSKSEFSNVQNKDRDRII